jgi:hypothetical protein
MSKILLLFVRLCPGILLNDWPRPMQDDRGPLPTTLIAGCVILQSCLIPAARMIDSSVDRRAAGILLISRAAATPTLRAYRSVLRTAGMMLPGRRCVPGAV